MSKRVITINRMLGSNGRLIGKALAEELGFAFYDKELIDIAAQKISTLDEDDLFKAASGVASNSRGRVTRRVERARQIFAHE